MKRFTLIPALLLFGFTAFSQIQPVQQASLPPLVSVSGTGEIKVQPDEIMLNLAVDVRGKTLEEARKQNDEKVASILNYLKRENNQPEFNYRDDITTMMFSLQLDDVLIVAHLLDNGFLRKAMTPVWREIEGKALYPIQAAEFAARVYYAAYLFNLIPDYFVRKQKPGDTELIYDTLVDDITGSIFNPWENDVYATALEKFWLPWHITRTQILQNPDFPLSFILTEEGAFRELESWEIPA